MWIQVMLIHEGTVMSCQMIDVQQGLAELKSRVESLQQTVSSLQSGTPNERGPMDEILAFTRELFPGEVKILEDDDPEIPDQRHWLLQVTACGSIKEVAARNDQWHRQLCQVGGRVPGRYRLSISVKQ